VTTKLKKESNQTAGAELLEDVADLTTKRLILDISREAIRRHAYHVVVTNIPGPPLRLYMLGAQLKAMIPLVPIPPTQNLGMHEFVETLEASFEEYKQLAAAHAPEVSEGQRPNVSR
ncbi:MAG: DUF1298 domain-containing protein, partial [Deltaproteobacteria bacterium]|nr:DUF1298 domain-containing protein [Deltaproteobacteria bacterium]